MRFRLLLCFVAALFAFSACGDDGGTTAQGGSADDPAATTSSTVGGEAPAFEESEADEVLEYELADYKFVGPTEAEAGKLFFKAENTGTEDHELEILDANGEAVGEVEAMPPGDKGTLAVELEPGTYTLQCILETKDGKVHKDLGMEAEFTVK